jgi:hypothetical protein
MSCVYGLFSSKEPDRVRYIGISKNENADRRLITHLSTAKSLKKVSSLPIYKWINKHTDDGHSIGYILIENNLSWEEACFLEKKYISDYKLLDSGILNMTDGGDGFTGRHTEETREKIKSYWTQEKRDKQRELGKLKPKHIFTEDEIFRMSEAAKTRHKKYQELGLAWGIDVGPKDKIPKEIKERIKLEKDSGLSYRKIADGLNSDKVPTSNGKKWYPTSVKNIYDRFSV